MKTQRETGFQLWCNACDDFPSNTTITGYRDHITIECKDCGNSEVLRDD